MNMQADKLNSTWLINRGYTIRAAARAIHRSPGHLARALRGERDIAPIAKKLMALPQRDLVLREKLQPTH